MDSVVRHDDTKYRINPVYVLCGTTSQDAVPHIFHYVGRIV
jgi:hypothetical protein